MTAEPGVLACHRGADQVGRDVIETSPVLVDAVTFDAQAYSHRRQCADNWRPSCSCAAKFAGRMANNIATGALSRTRGSPAGAWCGGTCCIWARSTIRQELAWRRSIEVLEDGAAP